MSSNSSAAPAAAQHEQLHHADAMTVKIGMWLFLFTEMFLFGTMFLVYAVYLHEYHWDFRNASHHLEKLLGATNTAILLTSSLTMALAIAGLERRRKPFTMRMLSITIILAMVFLSIKAFEWYIKISHGIYPSSEGMKLLPVGEQTFLGMYFVMTGLHGLHVFMGIIAITTTAILVRRNYIRTERMAILHNVGLYWHLVDLVWIFLFPLFYLLG